MSNYRKTMSDALREMYPLTEETQLDEAKIAKKVPAKDGGHFVVLHRDTSGMRGTQDKFHMRHLKNGKVKDYGTHSSLDGALKFAKNRGIIEEVELVEGNIDKIKDIVSKKQAMKIDGVMVDSFTASAISQIYDKVNDANKKKMDSLPITKLANLAMKMMQKNDYVPEEVDLDEAEAGIKVHAGPDHDRKVKRIQSLAKQLGAKVTNVGKSTDGKMSTIHVKGSMKVVNDLMKLRTEEVGLDEAMPDYNEKGVDKEIEKSGIKKGSKEAKLIHRLLKGRGGSKKEEVELDEFTKKDFDSNEDQNMHTENAVELARKFGTSKEYDQMVAIYKAHMKRGEISRSDQMKRDALVKKYLPKLKEEVDLDEGYLELTFKSKQDAEKAYNKINNEIFAAGSVPYDDMNQEGNEIQFDLDGNLNRRNDILKDLKSGGIKNFKVTANEELDENRMSQLHQMIKDKKSAEEIAKEMKLDVKTVKALMNSHHPEDVDESAASDARRAMSKDKDLRRGKDSADVDDNASDDDIKGASKNIMMQMRKAQSLSGRFDVEFADKKKVKIPAKMAIAVQQKYNAMKKPADKEKFQARIGKSYKDMLSALKEELQPKKESILERMNRKIKENKDG